MPLHPLDSPDHAGRLAMYRAACFGILAVLGLVTAGFGLVVHFALGNIPLAGRGVTVMGVPAVAVAGLVATPVVIGGAWALGRRRGLAAVRKPRAHPELVGDEFEQDRTLAAVGARLFATFAPLFAFGAASALLYHLTSAYELLGCVGAYLAAMLVSFPTNRRLRRWYDDLASAAFFPVPSPP